MLPQNGHSQRPQQQQQAGFGPTFMPPAANAGFDAAPYFNMDPSQAAKQMAALNAASHARIAANPRAASASLSSNGGTSSGPYFGGIPNSSNYPMPNHDLLSSSASGHAGFQIPNNHGVPPMPNSALNPSLLEPSMSQSSSSRTVQQRQQGFLQGLHNLMAKRNAPLPPGLTGIHVPNFDPNNTPWSAIELGSEVGCFRLAGKDVNLFKLWGLVFQNGGGQALTNNHGWSAILPHFDLPEEFPSVQANGSNSVSTMLSQYYMAILYPFEESYRKTIQENQRKATLANRQASMMQNMQMSGGPPGQPPQQVMPNGTMPMQRVPMNPLNQGMSGPHSVPPIVNGSARYPPMAQPPHQRPQSGMMMSGSDPTLALGHTPEVNLLDQDTQGIKRKLDSNDLENKRARPRTDGQDGNPMPLSTLDRHPSEPPLQNAQLNPSPTSNLAPPRPRQKPLRNKIEYIPRAREVDTYGGRDLKLIESELAATAHRRPLRDLNDWGTVDIESLTMSIRSRLATELSYALTTFTLLSTMRGQTAGSGFPIFQCVDLLEEALDLVEDMAFDEGEASGSSKPSSDEIVTNRQLVDAVIDEHSQLFAALEHYQGSKDPDLGPMQRPANYILAVINIIRNLSIIPDNMEFLARHERLIDLMLRVCAVVTQNGVPSPVSTALSLSDLISIRKDTLYTLSTLAGFINLPTTSPPSKDTLRIAKRAFDLIASYLIDPVEAVSPVACVQQAGVPLGGNLRPPMLADIALEVFDRFGQPDHNRQVLMKAVSQYSLWILFESLVHRLPISDADFQLVTREHWLSYLEKSIMAIYSLVFMAPPDLKQKMRSDRRLGFKGVMARLLHRFLNNSHEGRAWFFVCARRATETLKVLDDALDPFENPVDSATPALSFGMGFADSNDSGMEKGTGLLGGHRDLAWDILMMREVQSDEMMFNELESLVRVECQ